MPTILNICLGVKRKKRRDKTILKSDLGGSWRGPESPREGVRGRSGGVWGRLGVPCGGVQGRLGAILEAVLRQHDFRTFFGSILGSFWAPKGVGNGAQVGPRSDPNRRRKRRCEKKRFKIVLGRSWGGLGAVLERSGPNLRPFWDHLEAAGGSKIVVFP